MTSINQHLENITQSGTSQVVETTAIKGNLTTAQTYCLMLCITLIFLMIIYFSFKLIQTVIIRVNFLTPKMKEQIKQEILADMKKR